MRTPRISMRVGPVPADKTIVPAVTYLLSIHLFQVRTSGTHHATSYLPSHRDASRHVEHGSRSCGCWQAFELNHVRCPLSPDGNTRPSQVL